jgi:hypothetical protein
VRLPVPLSPRVAITATAILIAASAASAGLAASAGAAPAASRAGLVTCGPGTLHGTYLFSASGFLASGATSVPFAFSGHEHYDGAGSVQGVLTSSDNGTIARGTAFTGTYTVAPDCAGALTVTLGSTSSHYDLYIAPGGNDFTYTQTDPGVVLSATETRAS